MTGLPLGPYLEAALRATDVAGRRAADPVAFVHRYRSPADQEVAAVFAAALAYGRVAAFRPVLDAIFAVADAAGGPHAWVVGFEPEAAPAALRGLVYRWNRGPDLILLAAAVGHVVRAHGSLERLLPPDPDARAAAEAVVGGLRDAAVHQAGACGIEASGVAELPRGVRYLLPVPSGGSACKRWMMFLRWMVRPTTEGIDLGLWTRMHKKNLVIPLDTHVLRIARFLGLTDRSDSSWRTAVQVTDRLRTLAPDDPVRFDFALAHLGISGACRGRRHIEVCPTCPLDPVCAAS